MNPMRLLIAVGVLAALGGFVYWSEENPPVLDDEKTPLVSLEKEDIRALTVERPGHDTIAVVRGEDDEWKFAPPLAMPANESSVDLLLNNLTPMNSDRVVEEEITDWRPFGVEGEAWSLRVDVTAKKEDEDEKTYRVIFGNDTPTGSGVFARLEGDPRLFTVFNYVKSGFEKEARRSCSRLTKIRFRASPSTSARVRSSSARAATTPGRSSSPSHCGPITSQWAT